MSVIAVKVSSDNIEIVSDSILVKGELKHTTNFPKLRRYVNLIVGGCGNAEPLIRYIPKHLTPVYKLYILYVQN